MAVGGENDYLCIYGLIFLTNEASAMHWSVIVSSGIII